MFHILTFISSTFLLHQNNNLLTKQNNFSQHTIIGCHRFTLFANFYSQNDLFLRTKMWFLVVLLCNKSKFHSNFRETLPKKFRKTNAFYRAQKFLVFNFRQLLQLKRKVTIQTFGISNKNCKLFSVATQIKKCNIFSHSYYYLHSSITTVGFVFTIVCSRRSDSL